MTPQRGSSSAIQGAVAASSKHDRALPLSIKIVSLLYHRIDSSIFFSPNDFVLSCLFYIYISHVRPLDFLFKLQLNFDYVFKQLMKE